MSRTAKKVMGGREQVRVCIAQRSPAFLDRDATVQRGIAIIEEAAARTKTSTTARSSSPETRLRYKPTYHVTYLDSYSDTNH